MGALIPLTVGETFGYRSFGAIMGLVSFVSIPTQVVAPVVAGLMFDAWDSYTLVFTGIVGFYLLGSVALLAARPDRSIDTG
jgi:hypothetical protein